MRHELCIHQACMYVREFVTHSDVGFVIYSHVGGGVVTAYIRRARCSKELWIESYVRQWMMHCDVGFVTHSHMSS